MLKRLALVLLLLSSVASAAKRDAAEEAYQEARKAYFSLKSGGEARRKMRHHWLNVVHRFEKVASEHPKSERAPDALFTVGELMSDLSQVSFLLEDLQGAADSYSKLVARHPRHRLADDAALLLARIYLDRLDQPEAARRIINEILAVNGKGDRSRDLKALLAVLPAPKVAPDRKAPALVEAISKMAREAAPVTPPPAAAAQPVAKKTEEGPRVVVITPLPKPVEPAPAPTAKAPVAEKTLAEAPTPAEKAAVEKLLAEKAPVEKPAPAEKPTAEKAPVAKTVAEKPAPAPAPAETVVVAPASKPRSEPPAVTVKPVPAPALVSVTAAPKAVEHHDEPLPLPTIPSLDKHIAEARLKTAARLSRRAELTLVEQLGLKVRRVVIDPGHGGHDTGAIGKQGTREKDITLAISKKLAEQLRERGLEVILTRDDDRYLKLEARAELANEARGDLFISIHCNSATNRKLRGVETYTLNISSDRYSMRLAARENATSEKAVSDLQFILADLATKANTGESSRLANQVQKSLVSALSREYTGIKDLGHKEALFYVLLGVKMPAILVETSFLSHAEEETRLGSEEYQDDVAEAIAQGVEDFLGDRNRLAKVD
ncbi:MAG TPA: N-acetylmuramoyl-L-alanine amidase [Myxococcaceae bacterium]|nr:N-acetylmuramoyl-L-alanine amidase [Myxococcaceae bacterium]